MFRSVTSSHWMIYATPNQAHHAAVRQKTGYDMPWNRNFSSARSRPSSTARWRSRSGRHFRNPLLLILSALAVLGLFSHHFHLHAPAIFDPYSGLRNCRQMRATGLSSIPAGHPAYRPWMDADHDGIACEPWHPFTPRR